MTKEDKIRKLAEKLKPFDLPVGVYVVTKEGRFVECDKRVREILKLPLEGPISANITDFYRDPSERDRLIQKLEEAEAKGRFLEGQDISFKVNGREVWVQDSCRSIRTHETEEAIGYLGCIVDITDEKEFQLLFELLPAGVYQLDADDRFVRVNDAFAKMFGYESRTELEGQSAKKFYAHPEEADKFREKLTELGSVTNEKVELIRKGGETRFVLVSANKIIDLDGNYAGREGTIVDVTAEEHYRRLLSAVPVGSYMVKREEDGTEILVDCNESFARMFEFDYAEFIKGKKIKVKKVHEDENEGYNNFIEELEIAHRRGKALVGFPLRVKTLKGRHFVCEVNTRLLVDKKGNILGRAGVVRDISDEVALRELRDDIGRVLHAYSSTLVMLQHSLDPITKVLGSDPFDKEGSLKIKHVNVALIEPARNLEKSLSRLIELADPSGQRRSALPDEKWDELVDLLHLLQGYQTQIPYPEFRYPALFDAARKVIDICDEIEGGKLSRDMIREVILSAV